MPICDDLTSCLAKVQIELNKDSGTITLLPLDESPASEW